MLWYDLSPMRPDEFAHVDLERWSEAVQVRNAYNAGIADARAEQGMRTQLESMEMQA